MAILELYTFPNKVLSQKCEDVEVVDDKVRKLLDDMLETMYHNRGVGSLITLPPLSQLR